MSSSSPAPSPLQEAELYLYPFQEEDVEALLEHKKYILGLEVGLGKTPITVTALERASVREALICCPRTIKLKWRREIFKWWKGSTPPQVLIYEGAPHQRSKLWIEWTKLPSPKLMITTYAMLEELSRKQNAWQAVVYDECHAAGLKNRNTKTFKAAKSIMSQYCFLLSGTPASRPMDYWAYLNLLAPARHGSFWGWVKEHLVAYKTPFGWKIEGAKNGAALNAYLRPYRVRRFKRDQGVADHIPPMTRLPLEVELTSYQQRLYNELAEEWLLELEREDGETDYVASFAQISTIVRLRQICISPAIIGGRNESATLEAVKEFAEGIDEPLVIFTPFRPALDLIGTSLPRGWVYRTLHGGLNDKQRDDNIQWFQDDASPSQRAMVCITQLASGFDLYAASYALCAGFDWDPNINFQAEGRIDREGQRKASFVYYIINQGTVEENVINVLQRKIRWNKDIDRRTNLRKLVLPDGQRT